MDYYSVLGVAKDATPEEIKLAYRQKVKQHHPDAGGDAETFKKVSEAYETLSNANKRSAYDNPQTNRNFRSQHFQHGNPFADSPFQDIFSNFGFHSPKNKDMHFSVEVDLLDVMKGKDLVIDYTLGSGKKETVTVNIPAGARHGDTIRYEGLGDDSDPRFPRGCLLIKISIKSNKNWVRDGNNIATRKTINVFDLMLGCAILLETLDNKKVKLNVPKGTKPGTILSINGYGIPDLRTRKPGNLYVQIETEIPNITDPSVLNTIQEIKRNLDNG